MADIEKMLADEVARVKPGYDADLTRYVRALGGLNAGQVTAIAHSLVERGCEAIQVLAGGVGTDDGYDLAIALLESKIADMRRMQAEGARVIPAPGTGKA